METGLENFLAEESLRTIKPLSITALARKFKARTNCSAEYTDEIEASIYKVRMNLPNLRFDMTTKLRMMFALGYWIEEEKLLQKLQQMGMLELSGNKKIIKFLPNDGSFELEGDFDALAKDEKAKSKLKADKCTSKEKMRFFDYIAEKSLATTSPLYMKKLYEEFVENGRTLIKADSLRGWLHDLRDVIPQTDRFDEETKVRILFATSTRIEADYLKKLRQTANITLDGLNRIKKYEPRDKSFKLEGNHDTRKYEYTQPNSWKEAEKKQLFDFILDKSRECSSPLSKTLLVSEYKNNHETSRSSHSLDLYIRKFENNFSTRNDLDLETKVRFLFALGVPIDNEYLRELEKGAIVQLDEGKRIELYISNDENFRLQGVHHRKIVAPASDKPQKDSRRSGRIKERKRGNESESSDWKDIPFISRYKKKRMVENEDLTYKQSEESFVDENTNWDTGKDVRNYDDFAETVQTRSSYEAKENVQSNKLVKKRTLDDQLENIVVVSQVKSVKSEQSLEETIIVRKAQTADMNEQEMEEDQKRKMTDSLPLTVIQPVKILKEENLIEDPERSGSCSKDNVDFSNSKGDYDFDDSYGPDNRNALQEEIIKKEEPDEFDDPESNLSTSVSLENIKDELMDLFGYPSLPTASKSSQLNTNSFSSC